jgi:transcriptional regulator with GAF, ATPase, and Fis domain
VRILDSAVSRRHALLHVGARIEIEDLGSANGTLIRDRPGPGDTSETLNIRRLIRRRAELAVGETLLLGTACVVVRHAANDVASTIGANDSAIVRDPAMRALYAQAELAAPTPISVLLLGETGVGKEVLARVIHARSARAARAFHAVNCGALCDSLLDSELFGHEKGAFTGAVSGRTGLLEAAAGGTVLLDEVGELSPASQAKLLRVVEERLVVRVGSTRPSPIDVRFIAATNRDLEADSKSGRFRADLYFRLNGLILSIPPLRERPLEVEQLAHRFLAAACALLERAEVPRLSERALACLRGYSWPGNVRELKHAMERAAVLGATEAILPEHLPLEVVKGAGRTPTPKAMVEPTIAPESPTAGSLPREIRSLERARIVEALARTGGIQSAAARDLGISRRTLISRIEAYGLPRPRKRADEPEA